MTEHRYTIKEIDELRYLLGQKSMFGSYVPSEEQIEETYADGWYGGPDNDIEDELRTLLIAGITPNDLRAQAAEEHKEEEKRQAEFEKRLKEEKERPSPIDGLRFLDYHSDERQTEPCPLYIIQPAGAMSSSWVVLKLMTETTWTGKTIPKGYRMIASGLESFKEGERWAATYDANEGY